MKFILGLVAGAAIGSGATVVSALRSDLFRDAVKVAMTEKIVRFVHGDEWTDRSWDRRPYRTYLPREGNS